MLDPAQCRTRQQRLLDVLQRRQLDAVVVGQPHHVYYLGGYLPFWQHHAAFVLLADGRSLLVAGNSPPGRGTPAADKLITYEASWLGTQRQEQPAVIAEHVASELRGAKTIALDASAVGSQLLLVNPSGYLPIDPELWQLRRRKDADELALMRTAIACTRAMYDRARQIIEPGVSELRVFNELHAAAIDVAGEPLSAHLGNDFACGTGGGPPRKDRPAKAGELYILDLGPAYRGYFADNSRAFPVDRKPTDAQLKAWQVVRAVFPIVERLAKPGVRCREIFEAVNNHYQANTAAAFPHHLGHGVGLQPHEFPHMNPKWDDTLQEGEVFTIEPGLYGPHLGGGMRLENQYLVTTDGVVNLTPFPLELA